VSTLQSTESVLAQAWEDRYGGEYRGAMRWNWGIVLMVLLALGGMEVHPGLPLEHDKIQQTLKRLKNPGGDKRDSEII
jgi:hypothetical protein